MVYISHKMLVLKIPWITFKIAFKEWMCDKDSFKVLEFNQYQKFDKASFIIYADLECIIKKNDGCKNHPKNWSTVKASEHILSGFSITAISSFSSIENKHDACRGKDRKKKFCEFLRARAMKVIKC